MINDVDESLRTLLREEALNGSDIEILLDAPTRDWAARRNSPTVDMYLYDIHEDIRRRQNGPLPQAGAEDNIEGYRPPHRFLRLSYLVTAWTQRPEDEHRLLSAVLNCLLRYDAIPESHLTDPLKEHQVPVGIRVGYPQAEERKVSDVWTSLGGDLKPSLDLVATVRIEAGVMQVAAALPVGPLRLRTFDLPEAIESGEWPPAAAERSQEAAAPPEPAEQASKGHGAPGTRAARGGRTGQAAPRSAKGGR